MSTLLTGRLGGSRVVRCPRQDATILVRAFDNGNAVLKTFHPYAEHVLQFNYLNHYNNLYNLSSYFVFLYITVSKIILQKSS